MVTGTNTLWSLWLAFFREHFVSIVSLLVLLPATLFVNWRYGLLLIVLCCVFAVLIAFIISRSEKLQGKVERYYSDVSERTTDTLGNIALVQSFTRIESEVHGMRKLGEDVLGAQLPVLSWWALATVITRTATTLTILAILDARRVVLCQRPHHGGRDRHVHELCDAADRQARAGGRLCQSHGDGRAAAARVLRRSRHDAVGA